MNVFERPVAKADLPKVVSERLGHASTSSAMDRYGHMMTSLQNDAATAVSALVDQ